MTCSREITMKFPKKGDGEIEIEIEIEIVRQRNREIPQNKSES